jgi:2-keto-4-pentenoate hydratase
MPRCLLLACAIAAMSAAPARAACPSDEEVARLAEALVAGRPAEPYRGLSMADAECARGKLVPLLERHWGPAVGYKAGLTSAAAQRRFGTPHPVYGSIFAMTVSVADGAEAPARFGAEVQLNVEPDLLVRVRDEGINAAGRDRLAVLRHLDQVIPFLEMHGTGLSGVVDGPNVVAANAGTKLGVVGRPIAPEATEEFARRLGAMEVVFSDDTREIGRAPGSALLGHPLDVIPWLVEDLARHGRRLRAGEIVSLGAFMNPVPAQPGRSYTARYEGLLAEPVSVSVRVR